MINCRGLLRAERTTLLNSESIPSCSFASIPPFLLRKSTKTANKLNENRDASPLIRIERVFLAKFGLLLHRAMSFLTAASQILFRELGMADMNIA